MHKIILLALRYRLYGHYKSGQDSILDELTLNFLKKRLLTYKKDKVKHETHIEFSLTDQGLSDFIKRVEFHLDANTYE